MRNVFLLKKFRIVTEFFTKLFILKINCVDSNKYHMHETVIECVQKLRRQGETVLETVARP